MAAPAVTPIVARDALGWALLTIGLDNARAINLPLGLRARAVEAVLKAS